MRCAIASGVPDLRSHRTGACTQALCKETGRSQRETSYNPELVRLEKASGRTSNFYTSGKSDSLILSGKPSNKIRDNKRMAEKVEKRGLAKGNPSKRNKAWTQSQITLPSELERVRQVKV